MPPSPVPKRETFKVPQAFAQALAFHTQGHLNEAERIYSEVLAHRPDHFDALQMLSVIKLAKGEPGEALRLISQAMHMRKPSPQVLVNYGMILHALKRSEEALESFDAALKQKSKFAEAHNNRGAVLSALGRNAEAVDCFHKALALKQDYAEAHYNLGSSLRVLGRYDEALVSLDRALALQPNYVKALNNRGAVMEGLNRLSEALVDYERALSVNPGFTEARNNRGRVLLGLDRADDAIDNFTIALKINPRDAEAWYQRGRLLLEISRYEEAAADLKQALAIEPVHAEARLASCFAELPVIYQSEAEIAKCRAAYEMKLRALGEDVERGALKGDLIKAIGARHPFLLAYQGENDRALQQLYGDIISRIVAQRFSAPPLPPPPAAGEVIRVGIVSSFFYRHSNWKIPIRGWAGQLDRKFSRHRLSPWRHPRRADRSRLQPLRPFRPSHPGYQRLAARNSCRRAAHPDLSRIAHGHLVDPARRATACPCAMQFLGPPGNQRLADNGLLSVERPDGAAGRRRFLH
jgi:protein O-GlcNAc transferase